MSHVLRVAAHQFGDPAAFSILVESSDGRPAHDESVDPSPSGVIPRRRIDPLPPIVPGARHATLDLNGAPVLSTGRPP
jgi:hypothetical protein